MELLILDEEVLRMGREKRDMLDEAAEARKQGFFDVAQELEHTAAQKRKAIYRRARYDISNHLVNVKCGP